VKEKIIYKSNTGLLFEKAYHQAILEGLKNEEEIQWEDMRHGYQLKAIAEREEGLER